MHNKETVFYIVNQTVQFSNGIKRTFLMAIELKMVQHFTLIILNLNSRIIFKSNSMVSFRSNIARRYGGVIYYNVSQLSNACYSTSNSKSQTIIVENNATVEFNNNQARAAEDSVFFSIS